MTMEERKGLEEAADLRTEEDLAHAGDRRGPSWRGWVLSILVAIALSVTATLLLGGSGAFRSDRAVAAGTDGSGCGSGSSCCPPADAGK
jgi:hypothetical protein